MFIENISLALHNLWANKIKTFLTELGIIIGIFSVILIMTLGDTLSLAINTNMQQMGANDVYLMVQTRDKEDDVSLIDGIVFGKNNKKTSLTEDDYISKDMLEMMCEEFKDDIYALNISYNNASGTISSKNENIKVSLTGTSTGFYIENDLEILAGNMFSKEDFDEHKRNVLVSKDFVDEIFGMDYKGVIGKEITPILNNKAQPFTIIGVYKNNSASGMQAMMSNIETIYTPLMTAVELEHNKPNFQMVQVISKVDKDPDILAKKIELFFDNYYRLNRKCFVEAITFTSIMNIVNTLLGTVTMAISLISGISLLVGGIGIMNIMLSNIIERTKEIGTRVSLGASKGDIRAQFLSEAVIICLIGGIVGVTLGIITGVIASNYMGYPTFPSLGAILIALSFSVLVGIFFGLYPANKAANMNPIDALRHE